MIGHKNKQTEITTLHVRLSELKTLEWDILNPDRLINLEIIIRGEQALFNLEIKNKSGSSINPHMHHSKVILILSSSLSYLHLINQNHKKMF